VENEFKLLLCCQLTQCCVYSTKYLYTCTSSTQESFFKLVYAVPEWNLSLYFQSIVKLGGNGIQNIDNGDSVFWNSYFHSVLMLTCGAIISIPWGGRKIFLRAYVRFPTIKGRRNIVIAMFPWKHMAPLSDTYTGPFGSPI
jgi:hypothetical protein